MYHLSVSSFTIGSFLLFRPAYSSLPYNKSLRISSFLLFTFTKKRNLNLQDQYNNLLPLLSLYRNENHLVYDPSFVSNPRKVQVIAIVNFDRGKVPTTCPSAFKLIGLLVNFTRLFWIFYTSYP